VGLTATRGFSAGGWGLQVLSVTLKSSHFRPTVLSFSEISGMYSSGKLAALSHFQFQSIHSALTAAILVHDNTMARVQREERLSAYWLVIAFN